MTRIHEVLKLSPIDGRLTVSERAALVEAFLRCARTSPQAPTACGEVAVLLGRQTNSDRDELRAAVIDSRTNCRRCASYAGELLARL